jgi:hypothetical protein
MILSCLLMTISSNLEFYIYIFSILGQTTGQAMARKIFSGNSSYKADKYAVELERCRSEKD